MSILDWLRPARVKTTKRTPYIVPDSVLILPVNRRARKRIDPRRGTEVLVIDEDPAVIDTFTELLKSADCLTLHASNAESGLEVARNEPPHLIFMEVLLSGMNGYAALRTIRADPALRHIPVIVMSVNEKAAEYFFGGHSDADDFMKKPFSREEVFVRIERLLDSHRVPRRIKTADTLDDTD